MRRVLTPKWLLVHVGVLLLTAAFLGLGWWQVRRAAAGNLLSFGYALEWPVFAGFLIFVWVRELRRALAAGHTGLGRPDEFGTDAQPAPSTVRPRRERGGPAYDDSDDQSLAEYNRYLAWLGANPKASPADYPG